MPLNVPEKLPYHKPDNSMEEKYVVTEAVSVQREDSNLGSVVVWREGPGFKVRVLRPGNRKAA